MRGNKNCGDASECGVPKSVAVLILSAGRKQYEKRSRESQDAKRRWQDVDVGPILRHYSSPTGAKTASRVNYYCGAKLAVFRGNESRSPVRAGYPGTCRAR